MGYIKRTSLIFVSIIAVVSLLAACPASAIKSPTDVAEDLTDEKVDLATKLDAVAENCANIKHALTQLQRADSRTRTYLGTSYEAISGRFITPLDLRLGRNNRSSEQLLGIQSEFLTTQSDFRLAYTDYMRDLESLIAINCSAHPEDFYKHLESTRAKRASLQSIVKKPNTLAGEQYQAVVELEGKL